MDVIGAVGAVVVAVVAVVSVAVALLLLLHWLLLLFLVVPCTSQRGNSDESHVVQEKTFTSVEN